MIHAKLQIEFQCIKQHIPMDDVDINVTEQQTNGQHVVKRVLLTQQSQV